MALSPNVVVVAPGELITAAHLNNIRSNLDRLDTSKLNLTGGTVTGPLTVTGATVLQGAVTASGSAFRVLRTGSTRPNIEFWNDANSARYGGVVGASDGAEVVSDAGPVKFLPNGAAEAAQVNSAGLLVGKTATAYGTVGSEMSTVGRMGLTINAATNNAYLNHIGAADVTACAFTQYARASTVVGSVTQSGTTGVLYNTTSDERLKTVVGPADTAAAIDKVAAMRPVSFTWNDAPGEGQQLGFLAQQLAPVAPEAVTEGTGAPGDTPDPQSGKGGFIPWMVDLSKLVPTLVAAIQGLTARIEQLEGAAL